VASQEWTDERLNHLATQVEKISIELSQLGQRVEQVCSSVDRLVTAITVSPTVTAPTVVPTGSTGLQKPVQLMNQLSAQVPIPQSQEWLSRLSALEAQVQQLTQQLGYLERRLPAGITVGMTAPALVEEEDIDDEPDEILWDFMEPPPGRTSP
jgi:hypothetical protein